MHIQGRFYHIILEICIYFRMSINSNFSKLPQNYLFKEVADRVNKHKALHPDARIINLGIGDVVQPLSDVLVQAMLKASREMGDESTFKGYGEYAGCEFLRERVAEYYAIKGVSISSDEVFVTDGAKGALSLILELFECGVTVAIPDPVYPVYVDSNVIRNNNIVYINGNKENDFLPTADDFMDTLDRLSIDAKSDFSALDTEKLSTDISQNVIQNSSNKSFNGSKLQSNLFTNTFCTSVQKSSITHPNIIYICNPNNPTGAVYDRVTLKGIIDYANQIDATVLYDAAYEAFVPADDQKYVSSIFQIAGAEHCAIEIGSLSKSASMSGLRAGFIIMSKNIHKGLYDLYSKLISFKTNGVSYISQVAAHAALSPQGLNHNQKNITKYLKNASIIRDTLNKKNIYNVGGVMSPYIWLQVPNNMSGWDFFDQLLSHGIVGIPGEGFGTQGKGYFRLSTFGHNAEMIEAMEILNKIL